MGLIWNLDIIFINPLNLSWMNKIYKSNSIQMNSNKHDGKAEPIDIINIVVKSIVFISFRQVFPGNFRSWPTNSGTLNCQKIYDCWQNQEVIRCDLDHYPESTALVDMLLQISKLDIVQRVLLELNHAGVEENLKDPKHLAPIFHVVSFHQVLNELRHQNSCMGISNQRHKLCQIIESLFPDLSVHKVVISLNVQNNNASKKECNVDNWMALSQFETIERFS